MQEVKWTIFWNEYSADTYLYGAEVLYHAKNDVEYRNELMPPGTVIKEWHSKTNYQMNKIEPTLPMIDGESSYEMITNIDTLENEECFLRLVFYDRFGNEAGTMIIRDPLCRFTCPLKTYSYSLQLINGGLSALHFHSIVIREIDK